MVNGNEQAMEGEETLAHLLEFLSRLEESEEVRKKVIEEIEDKVKHHITNKLTDFATEDGSSGFLPKTISNSTELRSSILKSGQETQYKHFTESFDEEHKDKYTEHLIDNIFPLFGCLYYMYYECATQCSDIKGADWWAEKCNETSQKDKKHLNQWLTDEKGTSERMIQRGFKEGGLSTKTGSELFPSGSDALLHYREGGHLQYCLYYMLFLPRPDNWDHAQSGHAVLFLQALCKKVKDGNFHDKYNDNGEAFKKACKEVTEKISTLIGSNTIIPVALSPTVQYNYLLQGEHFWQYIEWLKENLKMLIDSLQAMAMDVKNWDEARLKSSDTFGPYPWGFTFAYNWENDKQILPMALQKLNTALEAFQKAMDKIEHVSYAATIGSVIGGLGAAGAGAAAYAGSGFLGSAAEGVGRFFKGLFF